MKKSKNLFVKKTIVELNEESLTQINGGTGTQFGVIEIMSRLSISSPLCVGTVNQTN